MNKAEITKKLIITSQYFDKEVPEGIIEIYLSALSRFTDDQINNALSSAIQTMRFFPKVAELVEMIEGDGNVHALAAWDTVLDTVRKKGRRFSGSLGDRIDSAVRVVGGWEKICDYPELQMQFLKKDFVEAFEAVGHHTFMPERVLCGSERKALQ